MGAAKALRVVRVVLIAGKGATSFVEAVEPAEEGAGLVLTGILPTLSKSDLDMDNITPRQRYYALNEAPEFRNGAEMTRTPFQRIFGTVEDIDRQYLEIAGGVAPANPFLWTACWTTMDPTRAPDGKHTLICDTFVPVELANGTDWEELGPEYVDNVLLKQLQRYTTNMEQDNILGQYVETGPSLARATLGNRVGH